MILILSSVKCLMRRMFYPLRFQSCKVITNMSLSVKFRTERDECFFTFTFRGNVYSLWVAVPLSHHKCRLCSSTQMRMRSDCFNLYLMAFEDVIRFLTWRKFQNSAQLESESNPVSLRFVIITVISNNEKHCLHMWTFQWRWGMGQVIREQG